MNCKGRTLLLWAGVCFAAIAMAGFITLGVIMGREREEDGSNTDPIPSLQLPQGSKAPTLAPLAIQSPTYSPTTASPSFSLAATEIPSTSTPSQSIAETELDTISPTRNPTQDPPDTTSPTLQPTTVPPTISPTMEPTSTPSTTVPTSAPITTLPTSAPITTVPTSLRPTAQTSSSSSSLQDCLQADTTISTVVWPSQQPDYAAAKTCLVYEPGVTWDPLVVVQPTSAQQVAAVVRCARTHGATVSARSGAHSFVAASCRGHIVVDLQQLDTVEVLLEEQQDSTSSTTAVTTWGAGQLHGQVYGKLLQDHNMILPGGTEVMVGTGGLWLGCGRGLLTQAYGYTCDNLLSVEYVDDRGNIVEEAGEDMLWMAKGGGGFFPGIVTKFTAQAFPAPSVVEHSVCYLPNTPSVLRAAIQIFTQYLDAINDPGNSMFAALIVQRPHVEIEFDCFGCSERQTNSFRTMREELTSRIANIAGSVPADCTTKAQSYEGFLLDHATWDTFETLEDLQIRPQWPEWSDIWGTDLKSSAYSSGVLVPEGFEFTDSLINEIVTYLGTLPGSYEERTFNDFFTIYPMKGRGSDAIDPLSTAFGGRGADAVIHFKMTKVDRDPQIHKKHMDDFEDALVRVHGLPCRGFYNYQDNDLVCATTDDEYLAAFFSDPERMKRILAANDPDGVFFRLRLQ